MKLNKLTFFLLLLLLQLTSVCRAQEMYLASGAVLTEKIKSKDAHISSLFYLEDGNLYSFGSEIKNMLSFDDTRGHSFLALYDSNTLQKVKEWDLGKLMMRKEKMKFIEKIELSKKVWLIFKINEGNNRVYYKTQVLPNGRLGDFEELVTLTSKKGYIT